MEQDLYCSMIHGGLTLTLKGAVPMAQSCCLRSDLAPVELTKDFWKNNKNFQSLRKTNQTNQWDPGCNNCKTLESVGNRSFRTGMNDGLGITGKTDLSGPARIDLMFDISCNLACAICGPPNSTYWQKYLKDNNLYSQPVFTPRKKSEVIDALKQIDLSNLRMLVFCGGETLLGQAYWDVAKWLADNVPNVKQQLTLCFQTNGTQTISQKNFEIIEKFFLVKLHVSLDGTDDQFEYLRWPASWTQTTENILELKETLPSNVMFIVEETISIFNLPYMHRLEHWVNKNFSTNREGDITNHTRHLVKHNHYGFSSLSQEYVEALKNTSRANFIPRDFVENPDKISKFIQTVKQMDALRNQDFVKTFPVLGDYYARWL